MTNYNSTANYIFNLVLQVLLTAYLTWEMLLYGRVGWAVALILVNLAAIGINLYIWLNVKKGRFSAQKIKQGRLTILVISLVSLLCLDVVSRTARVSPENPTGFPPLSGRSSRKAINQNASASSARAIRPLPRRKRAAVIFPPWRQAGHLPPR